MMISQPENWRKSSHSRLEGRVEVGRVGDSAAVRDTKNRAAGYFTAPPEQWAAFVNGIKAGRFDG
jgi:hypothetical protein